MNFQTNTLETYQAKYDQLLPQLSERARRLAVAADARLLGHGGITFLHRTSGLSRPTIRKGIRELDEPPLPSGRIRQPGGGRNSLISFDPTLIADLEALIEPYTKGDPMSPLQWVSTSSRKLAKGLRNQGHVLSHVSVWKLLERQEYTLQKNVKTKEDMAKGIDRNAQFEYINDYAKDYLAAGEPVISVDTKKKELIGEYASPGREWRKKSAPRLVKAHDFGDKDSSGRRMKVNPYGVYDVGDNDGYVTVGITHDTSEFAVQGIRNWWNNLGKQRYPKVQRLLITPDAGGSNGYRVRLWKYELQRFADESGLTLQVCHFPRGTSKWNKIEHRLFSFITDNWQGKPLTSYQMVIDLIAATTTTKGLKVYAELDDHEYQTKRTVSDEDMGSLNVTPDALHPELNYMIRPRASVPTVL